MTLEAAIASTIWDALVIGAGPAGSLTALGLARRGCRVLLVDQARFPRSKVCGCCLNGAVVATLHRLGLDHVLDGAAPLRSIRIAVRTQSADLALRQSLALGRDVLDTRLATAAENAGAEFLPGVVAKLGAAHADHREVIVNGQPVRSRIVILASGLAGSPVQPEPGSRIGAGTVFAAEAAPDFFAPGTIFMATARHGYVGLVRVEDDRLDVAAAFDSAFVKEKGGPGPAAAVILREVGWPMPQGTTEFHWKGTPALTRRAVCPASHRLFLVGDAAGYVEPFTGEGIGWALTSAAALAPIAARAIACWDDRRLRDWQATHRNLLGRRQGRCRLVARVLRSPRLCGLAIRSLALFPSLARPVIAALDRPAQQPPASFA